MHEFLCHAFKSDNFRDSEGNPIDLAPLQWEELLPSGLLVCSSIEKYELQFCKQNVEQIKMVVNTTFILRSLRNLTYYTLLKRLGE